MELPKYRKTQLERYGPSGLPSLLSPEPEIPVKQGPGRPRGRKSGKNKVSSVLPDSGAGQAPVLCFELKDKTLPPQLATFSLREITQNLGQVSLVSVSISNLIIIPDHRLVYSV